MADQDHRLLVAAAGILSFAAMLNTGIATAALAETTGTASTRWALLGYQFPLIALLLTRRWGLDQGRTRCAPRCAAGGFALCGAASAAAPSLPWLIAAQLVQSMFGAMLFAWAPVLAARSARPHRRGHAMNVPAVLGALGALLGPAAGTEVARHLGRPALLLLTVPLCLVALPITDRDTSPRRVPRLPKKTWLTQTALAGSAGTALLLALASSPASPLWLLPAAGLVLVVMGPGHNSRRSITSAPHAAGSAGPYTATFTLAVACAITLSLATLYLGRGGHGSGAHLTTLWFALALAIAGPLGNHLADRFGPHRLAVVGAGATTLGLLLLVPLDANWSLAEIDWRIALAGLGTGLCLGPPQSLAMTTAPPQRWAAANSPIQLARGLGLTLGPALAATIWGTPDSDTAQMRVGLLLAAAAACVATAQLSLCPRDTAELA
ncbi:MFS transporter [Kitasatospora sp. GAS204B]|uniref:MFS transporter n=1 Tax=unclassified Kitasatospora TaxID=2633591 RepID=UPI002474C0AF|nr:MFS transporter [Kitasatospora sp. GAS204B]MDH6119803.1 DHA2 family multidrug resistance protein-like MFS transporter [Kitasatospora sp. GAS204B]